MDRLLPVENSLQSYPYIVRLNGRFQPKADGRKQCTIP